MRNTMEGARFASVLALLIVVLASIVAVAQLPTAAILGVVSDSSGAVVPNANLTARNVDTGQTRSVVTDGNGAYRFAALPVGSYEVRVEHGGFETLVRSGLVLTVAQEAVINFALQVGSTEQTVAVTAEAPLVNTTSGTLGGLVNEDRIETLPINGRNYIGLTLMQTGISEHKDGPKSVYNTGSWFSSNGAPLRSNNFLLDGAIMQDIQGASSASLNGATLGMDGIREYRVITSNFSAEYGMTMGSQTVMVSKGGTNNFHGSAFEYFRNDALDARNYFDYPTPASTRRLPAFTRNNFGGSFGGPIRKDKTFFFATIEELRERLGITNVGNGIPLSARVDGGLVPQISPIIKPFLKWFPIPNLPNNQFTLPVTQRTGDNYGQIRVDNTFSATDNVFVRYTIQDETQTTPSSTNLGIVTEGSSRNQYATIGWNHVFSPRLLNTFRASFSATGNASVDRFPSDFATPELGLVWNKTTNSPNPPGSISIGGGISGLRISYPNTRNGPQHIWTLGEDLFYTKGRHSLKVGGLINLFMQRFTESVGQYGSISFATLTDFLLAQPLNASGDLTGQSQGRDYHNQTYGFYAQDDVRATSRLTLNLGLRYEFYTVPWDVLGHNDSLRNIATDQFMTPGPIMLNPSLHNFSPRLGFAWDVMGDGKTSVRGGAAYLYDIGDLGSALVQDATGKPPYNLQSSYNFPSCTVDPVNCKLTSLPIFLPPGNLGRYQRPIDYHYGQPHNIQYNLSVSRQLPFDMVATVAYSGSRGLSLAQIREGNPLIPGGIPTPQVFNGTTYTGTCVPRTASQPFVPNGPHCWLGNGTETRLNPYWDTFTLEATGANSKYNSLQLELLKRISKGLQFQSSFTWSKNLVSPGEGSYNNQNVGKSAFAADPTWTELDYGPAVFDLPFKWSFNLIYNLPNVVPSHGFLSGILNNWWTSTIVNIQSGYPFSPGMATNRSHSLSGGSGVGTDRPDILPGYNFSDLTHGTVPVGCGSGAQAIPAGTPLGTPKRWYNPCAFTIQPSGFLGNMGSDALRGPGYSAADLSVGKNIPMGFLGEAGRLQFRAELFNVLNHANFALPDRTVFIGKSQTESPLATAGQITSTVGTSRQVQLSLRVEF